MTTTQTVGNGQYTYEMIPDWAKVPEGWNMPAAAVYGDSEDRVYCFNRDPDHPIMIFDRDGNFLSSWGAGLFAFPTPSSSMMTTMFGWWNGTKARL